MKITGILLIFLLLLSNDDARRANDAYNRGDFAEAEQGYRDAIRNNPDDIRLYFNLGNALARQGKMDDAIQAYEDFKMLSNSPSDHALADYNIGNLHGALQEWDKALERYRASLRSNPEDVDTKHNFELANRLLQQNAGGGDDKQQQDEGEQQNQQEQQQNGSQDEQENQTEQRQQQQQQQGTMSQDEAESVLNALDSKEKELIKDFMKNQNPQQSRHARDW